MRTRVATHTKSDEVVFRVIPELAPRSKVMHLQLVCTAAVLAAPAIPF